jgi:hypothetical protein
MVRTWHEMTEALLVQLYQICFAVHRRKREALFVIGAKMPKVRVTQSDRVTEHRLKYRLKAAGRGVDDLQDLGSCGLLGVSLIALDRPLSQLLMRFVPIGSALGKLTFEIGYPLLGIG